MPSNLYRGVCYLLSINVYKGGCYLLSIISVYKLLFSMACALLSEEYPTKHNLEASHLDTIRPIVLRITSHKRGFHCSIKIFGKLGFAFLAYTLSVARFADAGMLNARFRVNTRIHRHGSIALSGLMIRSKSWK